MTEKVKIFIFGDSLMKATTPDPSQKLRFNIKSFLDRLCLEFPVEVKNCSHFGCTTEKGLATLKKQLEMSDFRGARVLLEYGGNDCDYDWTQVSARPDEDHLNNVPLPNFEQHLTEMVQLIRGAGAKPVMMTLPPISADNYFERIVEKGNVRENVLQWLGDKQEIYRQHEMYSNTVARLAGKLDVQLIDVRSPFLLRRDFTSLVSNDGIHPTLKGYELIYSTIANHMKTVFA
ncbi:MAG: SGNH/GDSL hydrolase family protein [Oscillospiraceae bacterium]|nr:SGNH/GDSL hydrolase family protein [Oscillospiraceae bacterium]